MLGQQQKTGVLNLQGEKKSVQVLFDQGKVVGVAFPQESGEESALGRRLMRGGLISAENWRKAFQQHKEGFVSIEKALVGAGMVTREDLSAAVRLLIFDTVYGLFKWKGGSFRFETKPVSYDSEFVEPLSAEYLLLDVLRMVDEWPLVAERLPNFDIVLQKTNPMANLDVLSGTPWEKTRTFQMEVIYDLIDGQRSIKEIIDLSFVEEFETCKNIITMLDAGLIESTATVSVKKEKVRTGGLPFFKYLPQAGAFAFVGVLVLAVIIQVASTRTSTFPWTPEEARAWGVLQTSLGKLQEQRVKNAREVFFLEENRYPQETSELVKKGLLNR